MPKVFVGAIAAMLLVSACGGGDATEPEPPLVHEDISGTYKGDLIGMTLSLDLAQKGALLTGSYSISRGYTQIVNGNLTNTRITGAGPLEGSFRRGPNPYVEIRFLQHDPECEKSYEGVFSGVYDSGNGRMTLNSTVVTYDFDGIENCNRILYRGTAVLIR